MTEETEEEYKARLRVSRVAALAKKKAEKLAKRAARAAAPKKPATPSGTCQICERTCKLVGGKISLHGYNRPGTGEIHGRCPGAQQPPWEVSCDMLKTYVKSWLEARLEHVHKNLVYVTDPGLNEVSESKQAHRTATPTIVIHRRGHRDTYGFDNFAILVARRTSQYESEIRSLGRELARQRARLASWAPK